MFIQFHSSLLLWPSWSLIYKLEQAEFLHNFIDYTKQSLGLILRLESNKLKHQALYHLYIEKFLHIASIYEFINEAFFMHI